jgi:hypothetical protein
LSQADFDLAASKNITIALITSNYIEDKRLGQIANKADEEYVDTKIADLVNSALETIETSAIILRSSTPGSNKKFRITIDDDGILSSEEMSE